jgi:FkbM family methyltransferase
MLDRVIRRVRNGLALCDGLGAYLELEAARVLGGSEPRAVRLRLRPGGLVRFRNHTSDYATMVSCFLCGYHRPLRPLPPNPVILDLGANVGYTMLDFRFHHPGARIIGVELDARNLELARRNVEGLGMELVHAAVFHRDGEIAYDAAAAFDAFQARAARGGEHPSARVPALTMGTLMRRLGVTRADYVKVDIEGAEKALFLEGDLAWLDRVGQISIELHGGIEPEAVAALLREHGMRTQASPSHWSAVVACRD